MEDKEIKRYADEIVFLLKGIREEQSEMVKLLKKYDNDYLVEMERQGQYLKED